MARQNKERFEKLRALSPLAALQAWAGGSFGVGDEPAMIEAIRRDPRIVCSDAEIVEVMSDTMDKELDASECLKRLARIPQRPR